MYSTRFSNLRLRLAVPAVQRLTIRFAALMVLVILAISVQGLGQTTFQIGDVFAAIGNGKVNWYHQGTLVKTLDTGAVGFTTGMAFDQSNNLYVTAFSANAVYKFNNTGASLGPFVTGLSTPESIVFDNSGNAYISEVSGTQQLVKVSSSGAPLGSFATGRTDWIDLASDQHTILYTSEGQTIFSFNTTTNTQNPAFTTGLPVSNAAFALRIVPATGDVLVADTSTVIRLNSAGTQTHTYTIEGSGGGLFGLNLDPDGVHFWTSDFNTGKIWQVRIDNGNIDATISTDAVNDPQLKTGLFGVAVFGETTAAEGQSITHTLAQPGQTTIFTFPNNGTNATYEVTYPLGGPDTNGFSMTVQELEISQTDLDSVLTGSTTFFGSKIVPVKGTDGGVGDKGLLFKVTCSFNNSPFTCPSTATPTILVRHSYKTGSNGTLPINPAFLEMTDAGGVCQGATAHDTLIAFDPSDPAPTGGTDGFSCWVFVDKTARQSSAFADPIVVVSVAHNWFSTAGAGTLGTGNNGVSPATENVLFQVGKYSAFIPKGSFKQGFVGYDWTGTILGVKLAVGILPLSGGKYAFSITGLGTHLGLTSAPATTVPVELTIGDDYGTKSSVPVLFVR